MRFPRTASALDRLADALRRSDASWAGGVERDWEDLDDSERAHWRGVARRAAAEVCEEADEPEEPSHPRWSPG